MKHINVENYQKLFMKLLMYGWHIYVNVANFR